MESPNAAAWERLGMLLTQRRAQIDPRYGRRTRFAEEHHLGHRVVYEIEKARRQNFGDGTIAAIEAAYELVPGSLRRTLDGGPLEIATRIPEPGAAAGAEPTEPVPPAVASAISTLVASLVPAVEVEVRRAEMRHPGAAGAVIFADPYEARIWDLELPWPRRVAIIAFLRATRAQREAGNGEPNTSHGARLRSHMAAVR